MLLGMLIFDSITNFFFFFLHTCVWITGIVLVWVNRELQFWQNKNFKLNDIVNDFNCVTFAGGENCTSGRKRLYWIFCKHSQNYDQEVSRCWASLEVKMQESCIGSRNRVRMKFPEIDFLIERMYSITYICLSDTVSEWT